MPHQRSGGADTRRRREVSSVLCIGTCTSRRVITQRAGGRGSADVEPELARARTGTETAFLALGRSPRRSGPATRRPG